MFKDVDMFISARIIPLVTGNEITHTEQLSVSNGNEKIQLISCFCVFEDVLGVCFDFYS